MSRSNPQLAKPSSPGWTSRVAVCALLGFLGLLGACGLFGRQYRGSQPASPAEALSRYLEEVFLSRVDRDPELRARLGLVREAQGWEDRSERRAQVDRELLERELRRLQNEFDPDDLDEESGTSFELFVFDAERQLARDLWSDHAYLLRPGVGVHMRIPLALRDVRVRGEQDAADYVARIVSSAGILDAAVVRISKRRERGIVPPRFACERAIEECRSLLTGRPFEDGWNDGVLLEDLRLKLERVGSMSVERRAHWVERAGEALRDSLGPSYYGLIAALEELRSTSRGDHGVWNLPAGDDYYAHLIEDATTLAVTPTALHRLALQEVARIHDEMRSILRQLDHPGGLASFFRFLREDPKFYASNDEDGRGELLGEARRTLTGVRARLAELIARPTATELVIERSVDSTRHAYVRAEAGEPAHWDVDLSDTRDLPRYLVQALVYRNTLPGRHLREALTAQRTDLPRFRRTLSIPAWGAGWDLYAARLPGELGLYEDPYANFGRLTLELWAACQLVVDTGVHHERWTREQATAWLRTNTPNPEPVCARAVDGVLLDPGGAAAVPVGMIRMLELRAEAESKLGEDFDLRAFHRELLGAGPVPLSMLEERVGAWIESR